MLRKMNITYVVFKFRYDTLMEQEKITILKNIQNPSSLHNSAFRG